jgi:hypothetical protein
MKTIYALLLACGIAAAQDITTVNQSAYGTITATNAACTATSCVWLTSPLNAVNATVTLSGTFSATLQFEASSDGVNYNAISAVLGTSSGTVIGTYSFNLYGQRVLRVRCSSYTSGSVGVSIASAAGLPAVAPWFVIAPTGLTGGLFKVINTASNVGLEIDNGSLTNKIWSVLDTQGSNSLVLKSAGVAAMALQGGVVNQYNGISLVANGIPVLVAKADATAQAANIAATTLYAVPASGAGMYRVSCYVALTQPATTSSTIPACYAGFTDPDTNAVSTPWISSTSTGNTIGNTSVGQNTSAINAKASTNIQYGTTGYASSGATTMQYAIHVKLEYLGN